MIKQTATISFLFGHNYVVFCLIIHDRMQSLSGVLMYLFDYSYYEILTMTYLRGVVNNKVFGCLCVVTALMYISFMCGQTCVCILVSAFFLIVYIMSMKVFSSWISVSIDLRLFCIFRSKQSYTDKDQL